MLREKHKKLEKNIDANETFITDFFEILKLILKFKKILKRCFVGRYRKNKVQNDGENYCLLLVNPALIGGSGVRKKRERKYNELLWCSFCGITVVKKHLINRKTQPDFFLQE